MKYKTQKDKIENLINYIYEHNSGYCPVYFKRIGFNDNLYYTVINGKQRNLGKDYNDVEYTCSNSYDFTLIENK